MRYILAFVLIVAFSASSAAGEINLDTWEWESTGKAEVIDGDTIRLRGAKLRLWGIDAPEIGQVCETTNGIPYDCGIAAKVRLKELIAGREVKCFGQKDGLDRYGRQLAICRVWGVHSLNADLVREGWALAYRRYTDYYARYENIAQAERAGMWRGQFMAPWKWRKRRPRL